MIERIKLNPKKLTKEEIFKPRGPLAFMRKGYGLEKISEFVLTIYENIGTLLVYLYNFPLKNFIVFKAFFMDSLQRKWNNDNHAKV